jgi:hypothetical protein
MVIYLLYVKSIVADSGRRGRADFSIYEYFMISFYELQITQRW